MGESRYFKPALFILGILTVYATVVHAGITGSKHDFSGRGWGSNEICIFCHTPHNAKMEGGSAIYPLWNHKVTSATYIVYSSPTMDPRYPAEQPRGPSKLCLSCHDGTVAIDSYGNRDGTNLISGVANFGTNLSNDHPISIYWGHQTYTGGNASCVGCHQIHGGGGMSYIGLPFYERYLECSTCHEPHNKYPTYTKMLRKSLALSEICQHCHGK
ncbi:MAG: cytochrome c3 family protein [Thermodesulfobacteriota bacterium]